MHKVGASEEKEDKFTAPEHAICTQCGSEEPPPSLTFQNIQIKKIGEKHPNVQRRPLVKDELIG